MGICTIFVLYSGLTLATYECQSQLFYGDGLITPHEVVYTSHVHECWEGHAFFVPRPRINFGASNIRIKRYKNIQKRFKTRVQYKGKYKRIYKYKNRPKYKYPRRSIKRYKKKRSYKYKRKLRKGRKRR